MRFSPVFLLAALITLSPCLAQDGTTAEQALAANEAGIRHFKSGELEQALGEFRRASALDPKNATIRKNIARCYAHIATTAFKERRFEESARDFKLAEDHDPKEPNYPLSRGRALIEAKLIRDATAVLEALAQSHPELAPAHSLLGLAYYQSGRNGAALKAWNKALALDPKDTIAGAYRDKVKREHAVEDALDEDFGAPHFRIKFDGRGDPDLGRLVGRVLEDAYEEVGRLLGVYPSGETAVVIYPGRTFQKVTGAHAWVRGLYDGKIRIPGQGLDKATPAELKRIFHHEYSHALIAHLAGSRCPVWLHEGLAQMLDGSSVASARRILAQAAPPPLEELSKSFAKIKQRSKVQVHYAAAHLFTVWLSERGRGLLSFETLLKDLGRRRSLDEAFTNSFGDKLAILYQEWRR